ncbi:uncharacterized protein LOC121737433 [Aricia agestis]|uniref:uncharacterized protein LOC121737433 n=1 Tax=Aricia agestis TaxID=91739 RepID=UPI001C20BB5B|nr:uncharacterized protein LOC121737433 [Aricia agestis]
MLVYLIVCLLTVKVTSEVVDTSHGKVAGKLFKSLIKNVEYYGFLGIPYAAPPVQELRFKPPQAIEPWDKVLTAKKEKQACIQFNTNLLKGQRLGQYGTEDCLYLDIFTPGTDRNERPVVTFLYSERFQNSYNKTKDYGPDFFIEEDVIVVSISHRLAAFGFLSLEDATVPGNAGLKDIVKALEWVKNNIGNFGGDPNKITLLGSQGGAVAIDLLLHTEAKRLINAAILQSGTALSPMYLQNNAAERAFLLAEQLDIFTKNKEKLLKELNQVSTSDILSKEVRAAPKEFYKENQKSVLTFGPVVEKDSNGLVTKYPEDSTDKIDIPIMIGHTSREGLVSSLNYLTRPTDLRYINKDFPFLLPMRLKYKFDPNYDAYYEAIEDIRKFYFTKNKITENSISDYITYVGDVLTYYSMNKMADMYSNSSSRVYYYNFDYYSDLNENKNNILRISNIEEGTWGAATGDELCYIFKCPRLKDKYLRYDRSGSDEMTTQRKMTKMFANFARFGNPTPDANLLGTIWPAYSSDREYLNIAMNGEVIVETDSGKVAGKEIASVIENEKYYSFLGIPYALPPVGDLRFKAPLPHPGWEDVLEAKREKKACAQFFLPARPVKTYGFFGDEDCLHLSVHTPKLPENNELNLPVIVFTYNEFFRSSFNGSKEYGPDFFMNEDVILVTVNHRLGSLGFLSFEDDILPGNNGIKDVILALNWIKTNIRSFGGDPSKVTLMGNQGGGALVDILVQSKKAKGLFSGAILQSGTSFNPMYFGKSPRSKAIKLSEVLEERARTSQSLLERFSGVSVQKIVESDSLTVHADDARAIQRGIIPFGPEVEHDHPDAIITKLPEEEPIEIDVPIMIGFNSREGIEMTERFLRKPQYLTFADRDFLLSLPKRTDFHFKINDHIYYEAVQDIKEEYFEEAYIKISRPGEYITYIEDVMSVFAVDNTVRTYTKATNTPIYYYMFDYSGDLNFRKKLVLEKAQTIDGTWGATTGDELCYLFVCNKHRKVYKSLLKNEDSEEIKVLRTMVKMWTDFAKTGNPTPTGEFVWAPATKENKECLIISEELKMQSKLYDDKVRFWEEFLEKYAAMAVDGVVRDEVKDELCQYYQLNGTMKVCIAIVLLVTNCVGHEVNIKQGILLGSEETSFLRGTKYYAFKGVPYAEPPLGSLRFQPSIPHTGWNSSYPALEDKPTCYQYNAKMRNDEPFGISGSEDCLYLSVFTPDTQGSFPVIVFDYNDNFRTGFNGTKTYSPDFFMEENIIVVTIQHRLDIFGYLTTEDEVVPANSGIKDFMLGLTWVQQNIEKFGGDPSRVTLMGSRGGAILANILLYTQKASGLFSGVILQSGTAMEPILFGSETRDVAFKLGEILGIETNHSKILLDELQKIDADTLLAKEGEAVNADAVNTHQKSTFPFSPVVDNDVLPMLPENCKVVNDVPVLIGINSREGLDLASHYIFEPRLLTDMAQDFLFLFPIRTNFRFDKQSSEYEEAIKEVQNYYFEEGYLYHDNILEYAVYLADVLHNYALEKTVKSLSNEMESPVYYYQFDYRGLLNENSEYMSRRARFSMENWGATVGDELCYLHVCQRIKRKYEELKKLVSEQQEIKVIKKMVRLWANFARTGNPTPEDDAVIKKFKWLPVNKGSNETNYLHITKSLRMDTNPLGEREKFWDEFLMKYSQKSVDGIVGSPKHDEL